MNKSRIMLVLFAMLALDGVARSMEPAESAAKSEIERLGGEIEVRPTKKGETTLSIQLGGTKTTDLDVARIVQLANIENIGLAGTLITNEGLQKLRGVRKLRSLDISMTDITDDGVKQLVNFGKLEDVSLCSTKITDVSMAVLSKLPNLRSLDLSFTSITGDGLSQLKSLRNLEYINLMETPNINKSAVDDLQKALPHCWIFQGEPDPGPPAKDGSDELTL